MKCLYCNKEIDSKKKYCDCSCKSKFRYNNRIYIKKCIICGKEFEGKAGAKCCSSECSLKAQQIYVKTCPVCSSEFKGRGNGVYCSKRCYKVSKRPKSGITESECEVCGAKFKHLKNDIKLVCSKKCESELMDFYVEKNLRALFGTTSKMEILDILKVDFQNNPLKDNIQKVLDSLNSFMMEEK